MVVHYNPPHRKQTAFITNNNRLILLNEIIDVYSGNYDTPETLTKQTRSVIKMLKLFKLNQVARTSFVTSGY
jgi:hypothetical protein